ncbi:MAG: hypothetical protein HOI85_07880, partial [Euryarchaeota archaeon]|nr:hypothetical protein [Euryarchaeota archaeon]
MGLISERRSACHKLGRIASMGQARFRNLGNEFLNGLLVESVVEVDSSLAEVVDSKPVAAAVEEAVDSKPVAAAVEEAVDSSPAVAVV